MTTIKEASSRYIGAALPRVEDHALVTGAERYAADLSADGSLHVRFVRSNVPHARLQAVECAEARRMPGVHAVYTAGDLKVADITYPPIAAMLPEQVARPAIAGSSVRFVGEIVAVVVAESEEQAVDAAEAVAVQDEWLPAVVEATEALRKEAPRLFTDVAENTVLTLSTAAGQATADAVVSCSLRMRNHRMAVAPMEGTAVLAIPGPDGRVRLYASTQQPHLLRDALADYVGMPPDDLVVICPAVGGGFGGKVPCDTEYALVLAIARKTGRPVRWVQSREENLMTMHARDHYFDLELTASPDGLLRKVKVDAITNLGAYPGVGVTIMRNTQALATGPYRAAELEYHAVGVATNTAPTVAFRGAGRPEAASFLERGMDVLARRLDVDPVELRLRNFIAPDEFPFRALTGSLYDSGDYARALLKAAELADYDAVREEQANRRRAGDPILLGIGVCCYVELSGKSTFSREYASVEVRPDGRAVVRAGTSAHGQGHRTVYAQIVADRLGIAPDDIQVVQGNTELVPWGLGTGGSRSGHVGGSAVMVAGDAVVAKARQLAAHLLEASEQDFEIAPGGLQVRGDPGTRLSWAELAGAAADPSRRPPGTTPGLFADPGFAQPQTGTAPFGCHIAIVEVDADTGKVWVRKLIAVDDCGTVLNPAIVAGQIHGGVAAGIGQALYEEIRYDDLGNPLTTSFADYLFPSAAELPSFTTGHTVTPSPLNPLGAKGVGESGTTGSLTAVHNAVVDALSHLGVEHLDLPLSPERVWGAIRAATSVPNP